MHTWYVFSWKDLSLYNFVRYGPTSTCVSKIILFSLRYHTRRIKTNLGIAPQSGEERIPCVAGALGAEGLCGAVSVDPYGVSATLRCRSSC